MRIDHHFHFHIDESHKDHLLIFKLTELLHKADRIMATQAEVVAKLQSAAAKQEKTIAEISDLQSKMDELRAEIVTLKDIIAAGGDASPELVASADRVDQLAGQADDKIPDLQPIPTP